MAYDYRVTTSRYQRRQALPPRQMQVLRLIEEYWAATGEPCPASHLAKTLELHHKTVSEAVAILFSKGMVLAPGSPITPAEPEIVPRYGEDGNYRVRRVVYFVLDPRARLIKIGRTGDLDMRLGALRSAHHPFLLLVGTVEDGAMSEPDWHRRFADSRVSGEWFSMTPAIRSELSARFGVDLAHWETD